MIFMKHEITARNANSDYDFFDEAFSELFPFFGYRRPQHAHAYMRTDVKENETEYVMEVELPGLEKKDIGLSVKDGYLNISVQKSEAEKDDKEKYIRRERSYSCSRSYYIGDVNKEDIKAKYENGILQISIPKETPKQAVSDRIEIE